MALSYFAARMTCPDCGVESDDSTSTLMQHELGDKPFTVYRVGDEVPSSQDDLEDSFLAAGTPEPNAPIYILQHWICPACGRREWAEVQISDGVCRSIRPIRADRPSFERMNWTTDEIAELYHSLIGSGMFTDIHPVPSFWSKLLAALPDSAEPGG
jgi:hypothetical protein